MISAPQAICGNRVTCSRQLSGSDPTELKFYMPVADVDMMIFIYNYNLHFLLLFCVFMSEFPHLMKTIILAFSLLMRSFKL